MEESGFKADTQLSAEEVQACMKQILEKAKGGIPEDVYKAALRGQYPTMCLISTYSPAKKGKPDESDQYTQVRFNKTKYYCHRIAALSAGLTFAEGDEASHRCSVENGRPNKRCFNPNHMAVENGLVNKSRLCCQIYGNKPGYKCPHQPPCGGAESLYGSNSQKQPPSKRKLDF